MKNARFCFAFISLCFLASAFVFAQSHTSAQGHDGSVTALCDAGDGTFFSAGQDGFVIRWNADGSGEHYQMSDLTIKLIAYNAGTNDVAIYETDGASVNRISVWNWSTFTKRYSKRFSDTVTAVAFSAKGTYLMVGTAAVNGTYLFNAKSGQKNRTVSEVPTLSSMIRSSASEKTAIMYSSTGALSYYDFTSHKQKAKFTTESRLEQTVLFGTPSQENRFFAGVKDNSVIISDATTGKAIAVYAARSPYICTSGLQSQDGFYFISNDGKDWSLKLVTNETLEAQLTATGSKVYSPAQPLVVKTFTGLSSKVNFTVVEKVGRNIVIGTNTGDICLMTDIPESEKYTLSAMTAKTYEKIYDIASDSEGSVLYCLTYNTVYRTAYDSVNPEKVAVNSQNQTNFCIHGQSAILWSKGTKKTVQQVLLSEDSVPQSLFTPTSDLQNVRLFGDKLVYIQGNSSVGMFNLTTGRNTEIYSGTSIQDAVLVNDSELYVAKTSSGQNDSALISVNIETMETVPLNIDGSVVFSLSYDYVPDSKGSTLYGVVITNSGEDSITRVFAFNTISHGISYILTYPDEDTTAFTSLNSPSLFTNIGKSVVYACNMNTKKTMQYKRSTAMAVKAEPTADKLAVLNSNGSLTWYNRNTQAVLASRLLTVYGGWE